MSESTKHTIEITADASSAVRILDATGKAVVELGTEARQGAKGVEELGEKTEQTGRKSRSTKKDIEELGEKTEQTGRKSRSTKKDVEELGEKTEQTGRKSRSAKKDVEELGEKTEQTGRKSKEAGNAVSHLHDALGSVYYSTQLVGQAFQKIGMVWSVVSDMLAGATAHIDAFDELSAKVGISAQTLAALELTATQSGISVETVAKSFRFLNKAIADATSGGKMGAVFTALGADVKIARSDFEGFFGQIAEGFASFETGQTKSTAALALFGRGGRELLPFLDTLGERGFGAVAEQARRLGLIFSEELQAKSAKYQDALDVLAAAMQGVKVQIAEGFIPALAELATYFIGLIESWDISNGKIASVGQAISELTIGPLRLFIDYLKEVYTAANGDIATTLRVMLVDGIGGVLELAVAGAKLLGNAIADGINNGIAEAIVSPLVYIGRSFSDNPSQASFANSDAIDEIRAKMEAWKTDTDGMTMAIQSQTVAVAENAGQSIELQAALDGLTTKTNTTSTATTNAQKATLAATSARDAAIVSLLGENATLSITLTVLQAAQRQGLSYAEAQKLVARALIEAESAQMSANGATEKQTTAWREAKLAGITLRSEVDSVTAGMQSAGEASVGAANTMSGAFGGIASGFKQAIGEAFDAVISGTRSLGDVWKGMLLSLAKQYLQGVAENYFGQAMSWLFGAPATTGGSGGAGPALGGGGTPGAGGGANYGDNVATTPGVGGGGGFLNDAGKWVSQGIDTIGGWFGGSGGASNPYTNPDFVGPPTREQWLANGGGGGASSWTSTAGDMAGGAAGGYASTDLFGSLFGTNKVKDFNPAVGQLLPRSMQEQANQIGKAVGAVVGAVLAIWLGPLGGIVGGVVGAIATGQIKKYYMTGKAPGEQIFGDWFGKVGFLIFPIAFLLDKIFKLLIHRPTWGTMLLKGGLETMFGTKDKPTAFGKMKEAVGFGPRVSHSNITDYELSKEERRLVRGYTYIYGANLSQASTQGTDYGGGPSFVAQTGQLGAGFENIIGGWIDKLNLEGEDAKVLIAQQMQDLGIDIKSVFVGMGQLMAFHSDRMQRFGESFFGEEERLADALLGSAELLEVTLPKGVHVAAIALGTAFGELDQHGRDFMLSITEDAATLQEVLAQAAENGFVFDPERIEELVGYVAQSATQIGENLADAILNSETAEEAIDKLLLGLGKTVRAKVGGGIMDSLLDETMIAGAFAPVFVALDKIGEYDLSTVAGGDAFMATLLPAIAAGEKNLEEYMPVLKSMVEQAKNIDEALKAAFEPSDLEKFYVAFKGGMEAFGADITNSVTAAAVRGLEQGLTGEELEESVTDGLHKSVASAVIKGVLDGIVLSAGLKEKAEELGKMIFTAVHNDESKSIDAAEKLAITKQLEELAALTPQIMSALEDAGVLDLLYPDGRGGKNKRIAELKEEFQGIVPTTLGDSAKESLSGFIEMGAGPVVALGELRDAFGNPVPSTLEDSMKGILEGFDDTATDPAEIITSALDAFNNPVPSTLADSVRDTLDGFSGTATDPTNAIAAVLDAFGNPVPGTLGDSITNAFEGVSGTGVEAALGAMQGQLGTPMSDTLAQSLKDGIAMGLTGGALADYVESEAGSIDPSVMLDGMAKPGVLTDHIQQELDAVKNPLDLADFSGGQVDRLLELKESFGMPVVNMFNDSLKKGLELGLSGTELADYILNNVEMVAARMEQFISDFTSNMSSTLAKSLSEGMAMGLVGSELSAYAVGALQEQLHVATFNGMLSALIAASGLASYFAAWAASLARAIELGIIDSPEWAAMNEAWQNGLQARIDELQQMIEESGILMYAPAPRLPPPGGTPDAPGGGAPSPGGGASREPSYVAYGFGLGIAATGFGAPVSLGVETWRPSSTEITTEGEIWANRSMDLIAELVEALKSQPAEITITMDGRVLINANARANRVERRAGMGA